VKNGLEAFHGPEMGGFRDAGGRRPQIQLQIPAFMAERIQAQQVVLACAA
jgi:hypothetical protein